MNSALRSIPVGNRVRFHLDRRGYKVDGVALNPAFTARPTGVVTIIRFGEKVEGLGCASGAQVEFRSDIQGDIHTGEIRRWRITKTFELRHDAPRTIQFNAVLTLSGDVSANFVEREGRAGLAMIQTLLADSKVMLDSLEIVQHSREIDGPTIQLEIKVAREIAIGRSGLVPTNDGSQRTTPIARAIHVAICDHLACRILPELAIVGASVVENLQLSQGSSVRFPSVDAAGIAPT